ncbi:MAG: flagellin modification protein FlmC [Nitrospirales bacterium]|nr:MAG: flagellin modification protein FlmC [Nitrospirales bacterium]
MLCILQARLSSQRLPGKMLLDIKGQVLLKRVVDRIAKARNVSKIIVATSNEESDQRIQEFCLQEGINYYCGSLDDVADRFQKILAKERVQSFVRICGDSPLIDPVLVDQGIDYFHDGQWDLVSNTLIRTFPKGQSVEVIRADTFRRTYPLLTTNEQREHVTKVFYQNPQRFRILSFTSGLDLGRVNLCIDTSDDVITIEKILDRVHNKPASWRELAEVYQSL